MNDTKSSDPRETLRRLGEFLDEDLPTDEEARVICAEMGADIPAITARIMAMVDAYEASRPVETEVDTTRVRALVERYEAGLPVTEEPPPHSYVAVRAASAPGLRYRARR